MDGNDFRKKIIDSMKYENKTRIELPEHNDLLLFLHGLFLVTGRIDILYCNAFLDEAIQLLINSIFLYEDGFFDCAFYSVRQANEVVNNMFYLSINERREWKKWSDKQRFPPNKEIKERIEKLSLDYKEIRSLIPNYFENLTNLEKQAHKVIHKFSTVH